MSNGSWLMAHGSSLVASGQGGPARPRGREERRARAQISWGAPPVFKPGLVPIGYVSHEPLAMSLEPCTANH